MKSENVIALDISTGVILTAFLVMRLFVRYHHRTWKSISKGWILSDMFVTLAVGLAMTLAGLGRFIPGALDTEGRILIVYRCLDAI